jgi:hypothetical protein
MLEEPGMPHFNESASACTTNFFYNTFGDEKIRGSVLFRTGKVAYYLAFQENILFIK